MPRAANGKAAAVEVLRGRVRVDARTKNLCRRLKRGEIAVINHADLDATAAYALIECKPAAVLNAAKSVTGRYPNRGPQILLEAGIPLIDECGPELMGAVREGQRAEVRGDQLWIDGSEVASGHRLDRAAVADQIEGAQENLRGELHAFARNTLEYLDRETDLALTEIEMPALTVSFRNRPVLVVVRGEGYKQDLHWVQPFIREQKPVLIAVDGGADALIESGHTPDLIVGDMDSATEEALRCGAELIVHAYADGRGSPGRVRLDELGLHAHVLAAPGTSEDVAMLLAHQGGASLIVAVGTHFSLVEFLDKRRAGMASTLLTRLKVGSILVDAKGLSRLYRPALPTGMMVAVLLSAMAPVVVVLLNSPVARRWLALAWMGIEVWLRRHWPR